MKSQHKPKRNTGRELCIPFGVLSVGNRVSDNIFKEDLEDAACFFVDKAGNTFHTASTSETADSGLCDTCGRILGAERMNG
jgi:hypothetical protein